VPDKLVSFGILVKKRRTFLDFNLVLARTIIPSQNPILTYVREAEPIWTRRLQKIIEEGRAYVDKTTSIRSIEEVTLNEYERCVLVRIVR
jgi:hypothetical protein